MNRRLCLPLAGAERAKPSNTRLWMLGCMSNQQVQYLINEIALGALATLDVAGSATNIDSSRLAGMRLSKMKYAVTYKDKTASEGPLLLGLASVDLSNAEIAEALVADPQSPRDQPAFERGNRQVFPLALLPASVKVAGDEIQVFRSARYPWKRILEGNGLKYFIQNLDGSTLTTGALVTVFTAVVGTWDD